MSSALIHPIGVPYPDVYEFLSCHNCNPCWGWLNNNETWRNVTSNHAAALNAVYPTVRGLLARCLVAPSLPAACIASSR